MDHPPVHILSDSEGGNESSRRFRAFGLKCPGGWMKDATLMELLEKAESCHVWFEKSEKPNGMKCGGFSVVFSTVEDASANFEKVRKMSVDGNQLHVQASKSFYDAVERLTTAPEKPPLLFIVNEGGEKANRTLYAIKLVSSIDKDLIKAMFDDDSLESVQIVSSTLAQGIYTQAEIVFTSAEQAQLALSDVDGTPINDGDEEQVIRLLSPTEYATYDASPDLRPANGSCNASPVKNGSQSRRQSTSSTSATHPAHSSVPAGAPAPEVTPEAVVYGFEEHISNTRINWAELNEVEELWKLCDEVSKNFGGLPDTLLKETFLEVLETHLKSAPVGWMQRHLDMLVKIWKKVVATEKNMVRETMVEACAPTYVPYLPSKSRKSKNADRKRALMMSAGVGQLLNTATIKLGNKEDGELDIDEDEHGNVIIGGQELSFASWGKMTADQEKVVVKKEVPNRYVQAKNEKLRAKQEKRARLQIQRQEKVKKMRAGLEIQEDEDETGSVDGDTSSEKSSERLTSREKRRKAREGLRLEKEKEDGEMSSDEEKRKAGSKASTSNSSSSSSESSSDEENPRRRKVARKRPPVRRANAESSMNATCQQYIHNHYANRFNLIRSMLPEQKVLFLASLKETVNVTTPAQKHQVLKQLKAHLEKQA